MSCQKKLIFSETCVQGRTTWNAVEKKKKKTNTALKRNGGED